MTTPHRARRLRTWFTIAFTVALLASSALSDPVGRFDMQPGDTCLGQIQRPGGFDEYVVNVARGARMSVRLGRASPGACKPISGILDANYGPVPIAATSITNFAMLFPSPNSAPCRIVVTGHNGTVGGYRVSNRVQPQKTFKLKGKVRKTPEDPAPAHAMVFGAYPGFTFTVKVKSRGGEGATVASIVGPDGLELSPTRTAKRRSARAKGAAKDVPVYTTALFGDHWLRLTVPDGTKKWSATVSLSGRLPKGTTHDIRPDVVRPAPLTIVNSASIPLVQVTGERGGPNSFGVVAEGGRPLAVFAENRTGGCVRATTELSEFPFTYDLRCTNGFLAQISGATRDADGELRNFMVPTLRDPLGSGSAEIRDIVYDPTGKPTGWTEIRNFSDTGRTHTLEFSNLQRYSNIDTLPTRPSTSRFDGLFGVDESIPSGTEFTDVFEPPAFDFETSRVRVGDVLRFVRDPADLVGNDGAIVGRNVRDLRIVGITQTTLTLAEPLLAETPPPGTRFQYFIARRTAFLRSYSVTHTGPDGRSTTIHNAGGRAR